MILVDSNVILDITGQDTEWRDWSENQVAAWGSRESLAVNCLIYAELSIDYAKISDLDEDLTDWGMVKLDLPYEAAFLAGRAFVEYRKRGGNRRSPLPDFYIGAHAQVSGLRLLTRDAARYRTYFPKLKLIAPD
jgi:predicted nucleic acid-binding protein